MPFRGETLFSNFRREEGRLFEGGAYSTGGGGGEGRCVDSTATENTKCKA